SRGPPSRGKRTLPSAERQGSRGASWKTKPSSRLRRAVSGGPPSTVTVPCVGATRSATSLSRVDLPHPDGPRRLMKPPGGTWSPTFSSAVTEPRSLLTRTVPPSSLTAGAAPGLFLGAAVSPPPPPIFGGAALGAFRIGTALTAVT